MAIPPFRMFFNPFLNLLSDGKIHTLREVRTELKKTLKMTEKDMQVKLKSGKQLRFNNRVSWVKTYLKKAGLITMTDVSHFKISKRGRALLEEDNDIINPRLLMRKYTEFSKFQGAPNKKKPKKR